MKKLLTISITAFLLAACQQPSFERKVYKSLPETKSDNTKFCIYDGKPYSNGSIIKAEGVTLKCGTYSTDVFDKTLSWGK
ncbi:DUF1496 domain-containing protein [Rodentibacter caecimuris]|uniref:DUF1496 domain-containing protein n=1 Tax=Rodentibacter caecimuris TaxID=1796644 RepID=A0AAJ3K3G1_9PAST|nr:DUF1496 domain-containing protein [Rodentibacter heylii]OOF69543.1 hypothetical protein BKG90_11755 [Rodentibacter heylii]OOF73109.1 hypothetical protein BKG99_11700 [Rodentibacter heylii]